VLANGPPHFGAEAVVEPGQQAIAGPLAEMMIDRLPRREVLGEEPPLGPGLDQIKDGIEDFTQGGARAAALFGGGQEAAKQVPLGVGEIGFVRGDFHRLKSAAANQSRKNSQSNQGIFAVFFFKQALTLPERALTMVFSLKVTKSDFPAPGPFESVPTAVGIIQVGCSWVTRGMRAPGNWI